MVSPEPRQQVNAHKEQSLGRRRARDQVQVGYDMPVMTAIDRVRQTPLLYLCVHAFMPVIIPKWKKKSTKKKNFLQKKKKKSLSKNPRMKQRSSPSKP